MKHLLSIATLWACIFPSHPIWGQASQGIQVRKIFADNSYHAFTSLIKFKGKYYCAFRSGDGHVYGADGLIRILVSKNAKKWKELTVLSKKGIDLRDPKLCITPDQRLMMVMGGSIYEGKTLLGRTTMVSFSGIDGKNFSSPIPTKVEEKIKGEKDWIWRITWYKGIGYGVLYDREDRSAALVTTTDGIQYNTLTIFHINGFPTEATIRFLSNGEMRIMMRRDREDKMGYWGKSAAPYTDWEWRPLKERLGGPDFASLGNNRFIASTRMYRPQGNSVGVLMGDSDGNFEHLMDLPSGNDCSYPGIVVEKKRVLISYYSSHDGKGEIYLAAIPMKKILP